MVVGEVGCGAGTAAKVGQSHLRRLRCLGMCTPLLLHPAKKASSRTASRVRDKLRRVYFIADNNGDDDYLLCGLECPTHFDAEGGVAVVDGTAA